MRCDSFSEFTSEKYRRLLNEVRLIRRLKIKTVNPANNRALFLDDRTDFTRHFTGAKAYKPVALPAILDLASPGILRTCSG
jgi:hypothetical protein